MWIIIGYLLAAVLLSPISKKYPKLYIAVMCLLLIFISGYRSYSFGTDIHGYEGFFKMACKRSLAYHWDACVTKSTNVKDPFYYLCNKLFNMAGGTFRGWLVFISAVYLGGLFHFIKNYSKNYSMSIILLVTFNLYFSMSGLRQTLAIGVSLWAFNFAIKRKPILFLAFIALAAQFHNSAWICVLIYFIVNLNFNAKNYLIICTTFLLALVAPGLINNLFITLSWNDQYNGYANGQQTLTLSGFLIQLLMLIFAVVFSEKQETKKQIINKQTVGELYIKRIYRNRKKFEYVDKYKNSMLNVMTVAVCFQSMTIVTANIFRMAMYFSVGCLVAVPNTIEERTDGRDKNIWRVIIVAASCIYMFIIGGYWRHFTMFGD